MKWNYIVYGLFAAAVVGVFIVMSLEGNQQGIPASEVEKLAAQAVAIDRQNRTTYDPNDPIYKFIPLAGEDWIDRFGDTEKTRLYHAISEIRVVVATQTRAIIELQDLCRRFKPDGLVLDPNDPNVPRFFFREDK